MKTQGLNNGKDTLHYIGILCNVDRSVLDYSFGLGFQVESRSRSGVVSLLSKLYDLPDYEIDHKLEYNYHYQPEKRKKVFVITKEFDSWLHKIDKKTKININELTASWDRMEAYQKFLDNKIKILRLFGEGDISLPISCFYTFENDEPIMESLSEDDRRIGNKVFQIKKHDLGEIDGFIQKHPFPFKSKYLQLAFEHFELSYKVEEVGLSLLSLMIALEVLFNDGKQELAYRIARGAAVLLGKNKAESVSIFKNLKQLYNKRSSLVHTGDVTKISLQDVYVLRGYIRKAIRCLLDLNISKDDLARQLTACGFGTFRNCS